MNSEQRKRIDPIIKTSILILFSTFFFLDYLSDVFGLIPRHFTWLPEVISIGFLIYIFWRLFEGKKLVPILNQTRWVLLFMAFTLFGIIINGVDLPVAAAGIRNNLKYLPLFFLPFFFKLDRAFIKKFLCFLFVLALVQLPVTIIQRIVYKTPSGDPVGGTLGAHSTGILSVFLTLCIAFWTANFIKTPLKPGLYILGFTGLIAPLGLSETKVSFFLLPVVFVCIFLFSTEKKKLLGKTLMVFICFVLGVFFTAKLHNYLYVEKSPDKTILKKPKTEKKEKVKEKHSKIPIEKYANPKLVFNLSYKRQTIRSGILNRIPQVLFAFDQIQKDPVHLLFGVGAGNASDSFFEPAQGKYYQKYGKLDIGNNLLSRLLWEYGLIGTLLFFFIFLFFFVKIWKLRKLDRIIGVTAFGFLVLIVIYSITSIYFNTMLINLFGYLFWFLGGYLIVGRNDI